MFGSLQDTFGFDVSIFIFESPTSEEQKKYNITTEIQNISIRHAIEFPRKQEEKDEIINSFSNEETIILQDEKLIAIPYFGDFYSMIVTIEAKDVSVDGIDASHILNMIVIFDWYMTDPDEIVEEEKNIEQDNDEH
nr:type II toxin-antitoxin system SpoIISA family toxin [Paenibacillus bovis]